MMQLRYIGIALCLGMFAHFAAAQANVNESLETISYWVDTNFGSDSNPGTQALPQPLTRREVPADGRATAT